MLWSCLQIYYRETKFPNEEEMQIYHLLNRIMQIPKYVVANNEYSTSLREIFLQR